MVFIIESCMVPLIMRELCTYSCQSSSIKQVTAAYEVHQSDLRGVFPLPMKGEGVKTFTKGLIYSSHFKGPVQKLVNKRLKRFVEMGLVVYSFKSYEKLNLISDLGGIRKKGGTSTKLKGVYRA